MEHFGIIRNQSLYTTIFECVAVVLCVLWFKSRWCNTTIKYVILNIYIGILCGVVALYGTVNQWIVVAIN